MAKGTVEGAFALSGDVRTGHGKGAARRTRATGKVPGIVYSKGKEALGIALDPRDISKAVLGPKRRNQLIALSLKDASGKVAGARHVMVRDIQIDPVRRGPIHIDFLEVDPEVPLKVKVPFEASGKSKASVDGAKTQLVVRTLNVLVKPVDIPEKIVFDVTGEGFGVIRANRVTIPKTMQLLDALDTPVVSLRMPRGEKEEEAAAAAPAADAAAAPAAAGKDGKAAAPAAAAADKKDDKKK